NYERQVGEAKQRSKAKNNENKLITCGFKKDRKNRAASEPQRCIERSTSAQNWFLNLLILQSR
ncbi:MAG: hypothetical protein QNI88_13405, partial [Desulfobacterales bacterium]|nr:hypothetical protein [Desulfobacterales bacterium]